ncbi:MAG: extracellular solute-binding protein [Candidatus Omnitrophica bacterium]|nr:extracellular solute-binding protein [Candidatus Omnitrophota bacterium]
MTSRHRIRVTVCSILALASLPLLTIGCGKSGQAKGPTPLRVWHWMTDREDAFNELAKRYQQQTGTPVRFELYAPSDVYAQKVHAAAQTNGLPDVYGILGEMRDLASFIKAGHVLPLEEAMNQDSGAWRNALFTKALAVNAFSKPNIYDVAPGVYGVPIDVMNIQVYYNTKLLAKLGLDPNAPPATWKAFLAVGKPAKEQGLLGFVSGWAEAWLIDCFATDYAIHTMGEKKVAATYRGDVSYTDPDWINVLTLFAQLRDSGLLAEGIVTMGNKRAEQLFANGQAVFAFNGTWGVNVYHSMNPDLEYGVMLLPKLVNRPMVTWGGAGSSFFVNAKSPRASEAIAFLKWLTAEPQQQYLTDATQNIPSNRAAAAALPPALAAFADDMDATVHPRLFSVQEDSSVIEAFDKGIQSILIGELTPEQVAKQVEDVKKLQHQRRAQLDHAHALQ